MFNAIMASQSYDQLRAVFDAYHRVSGRDIEQAIKGEMSGNLELGMRAIGMIHYIVYPLPLSELIQQLTNLSYFYFSYFEK